MILQPADDEENNTGGWLLDVMIYDLNSFWELTKKYRTRIPNTNQHIHTHLCVHHYKPFKIIIIVIMLASSML